MIFINKDRGVINMPGGDGKGPQGFGPMTGRGAGYCAGYPVPGYMNMVPGRGRGFGRGRGRGRGFGRGWANNPYAYGAPYYGYPYSPEVAPQDEAQMLKEQARAMQEDITAINNRIRELESAAKKEK